MRGFRQFPRFTRLAIFDDYDLQLLRTRLESENVNMSEQLEVRMDRIESDVQRIKIDTAVLRVQLRRTNDRIDITNKRIEEIRDHLTTKIDSVKNKLHCRTVQALLLLSFAITVALLVGFAKGFKWI
jgi:chromosome segregation ATPase